VAVCVGAFVVSAVSASTAPSGQVMYGGASFSAATMSFTGGGGTIEPAFDDATGSLVYLQTPNGVHVNPTSHNVAPLYLTVYPVGSGIDASTLNCAHMPADNCPDHGPIVAGAAMSILPGVYGNGVLGHDHLVGIASTGGDFNLVWEPVLVLFTNMAAAAQRITTLSALTSALQSGNVIEIPLPQLDFVCARVSAAAYAAGIPAPTVVGP
jgi:hypothetical protein